MTNVYDVSTFQVFTELQLQSTSTSVYALSVIVNVL